MLSRARHLLSLPLLVKDLTEQANRPRTYLFRVAYAAVLFVAFGFILNEIIGSAGSMMSAMGRGEHMFMMLVGLQLAGIYLFLPAMMCGAVAQEKERDALVLLLITDLSPGQIILQKYLARLIPMIGYLLLSLPLLAICFAYGGVEPEMVWLAAWGLLTAAAQVGAITLLASTYYRTTVAAFLGTYLLGGAFFLSIAAVIGLMQAIGRGPINPEPAVFFGSAFPPVYAAFLLEGAGRPANAELQRLVNTIPPWFITLACLGGCAVLLWPRAFVGRSNVVRAIFIRIDAWMNSANRVTGGVVLVPERRDLPGDRPIIWYEVHRRALGQFRYLLRLLLLIGGPVVFLVLLVLIYSNPARGNQSMPLIWAYLGLVWPVSALLMTVAAANLTAGERSQQTLDVLLTTPMDGRDIIREKAGGLHRLAWVLAAPMLTLIFARAYIDHGHLWTAKGWDDREFVGWLDPRAWTQTATYVSVALAIVVVNLNLLIWVPAYIGLKLHRPATAIIAALVLVIAYLVTPYVMLWIVYELVFALSDLSKVHWLIPMLGLILTPVTPLAIHELVNPHMSPNMKTFPIDNLGVTLVSLGVHASIAIFVRWRVLSRADHLLGRVPDPNT